MKVSSFTGKVSVLLLSASFLLACQGSRKNKTAEDESGIEVIKKEVILSPESQDLLYRLPTPLEITQIIQETRAPYLFSLTNPPTNVNRYFTQKTKALNLGIYSIDLAYSSIYQRRTETDQFLFCTGKLSEDLGIGSVYDKTLVESVNSHMDSRDSLIALIKTAFGKTSDFLRRNNRNQVVVLVAAGAFVEGLYIAVSLCQLVPDNSRIATIIFRQKESLDKLLRILGEYDMDSTIKPVADDLAKLGLVFTNYGLESGKTLPPEKVAKIIEITQQVRLSMIK